MREAGDQRPVRIALTAGAAFLGLVQFAIFFTDLPGERSIVGRMAASVVVAVLSGLAAGFVLPRGWLVPASVSVWGSVAAGAGLVAMGVATGPVVLVLPALTSELSAWIASRFSRSGGEEIRS